MCAVDQARSVESTLGFTSLDRLPMGLIAGMPAVQGIDGFVHRRHRRDFGKNPHGDRRQARLARA